MGDVITLWGLGLPLWHHLYVIYECVGWQSPCLQRESVHQESISVIVITSVPEDVEIVNEVDSKGCALCLEPFVEREKPGEAAVATSKSWDWTRNQDPFTCGQEWKIWNPPLTSQTAVSWCHSNQRAQWARCTPGVVLWVAVPGCLTHRLQESSRCGPPSL